MLLPTRPILVVSIASLAFFVCASGLYGSLRGLSARASVEGSARESAPVEPEERDRDDTDEARVGFEGVGPRVPLRCHRPRRHGHSLSALQDDPLAPRYHAVRVFKPPVMRLRI
jgi:hypothetical protein